MDDFAFYLEEWEKLWQSLEPTKVLWEDVRNEETDGNPILVKTCPEKRIAVRIIQFFDEAYQNVYTSYEDCFAEGEPEETDELVIACWYNEANLEQAKKDIEKYRRKNNV